MASVMANDVDESLSDDVQISFEDNDLLSVDSENGMAEDDGESSNETSGTFNDLANDIGNSTDQIILKRNYTYSDGDEDYKSGVVIKKGITIDGNGFTIDAKNKARHFNIIFGYDDDINVANEYPILIKNVRFINGNSSSDGGSICAGSRTDCKFINCSFVNNHAVKDGGAIFSYIYDFEIENCTFINNSAGIDGGALYLNDYWIARDSIFINNTAADCGGAIYAYDEGYLSKSTFIGNSANECSALKVIGHYGGIVDSKFINNTGNGLAVDLVIEEGEIDNNYFYPYINTFRYPYPYFPDFEDYPNIYVSKYYATSITFKNKVINYFDNNITFRLISGHRDEEIKSLENRTIYFEINRHVEIDEDRQVNYFTAVTDENGYAKISSDFIQSSGEYTIKAIFNGDDNNEESICFYSLTVNPLPTEIDCSDVVIDHFEGNVSACLKDSNGTGLKDKTVEFSNGNAAFNVTTDDIGVAMMPSELLESAGNYTVSVRFAGDNIYNSSEKTFALTVNPMHTTISADSLTTVYNGGKYLKVTLKDEMGNLLDAKLVSISVSGKKPLTTEKGIAKFSMDGLKPQKYTVKISFAGDSKYVMSTKSVTVTVKKATPKITAKAKTFKRTVKTKKYTITLKNNKNKFLKKTKVSIKINGKVYKATTNNKGKATFKITKLTKKGKFKSKISFAGSKYYKAINKYVYIKIK